MGRKKYILFFVSFCIVFFLSVIVSAHVPSNANRNVKSTDKRIEELEKKMDAIDKKMDQILVNQSKIFDEFVTTRKWIKRS